jgi:stringent starvation protein B
MGYTHYWRMKQAKQTAFNKAVAKANKVLKAREGLLASGNGVGSLVIEKDEVCFNGQGETCYIRNNGSDFSFCKTARKPYDVVVTAVLAIFAHELGDAFSVSSDGEYEEWAPGVKLASKVLGKPVPNPLEPPEEEVEG